MLLLTLGSALNQLSLYKLHASLIYSLIDDKLSELLQTPVILKDLMLSLGLMD